MNDEYIKREAVIKGFTDMLQKPGDIYPTDITTMMQRVPAEDVRPVVRGKWLAIEYMYGDPNVGIEDMWVERIAEQSDHYAYCSICGNDAGFNGEGSLILSNFCPNCGADMGEDS